MAKKNRNKNYNNQNGFKNAVVIPADQVQKKTRVADVQRPVPTVEATQSISVDMTPYGINIKIINDSKGEQLYQRGAVFYSTNRKEYYLLTRPMVRQEAIPINGTNTFRNADVHYYNLVNLASGKMASSLVQDLRQSCVCTTEDGVSIEALDERFGYDLHYQGTLGEMVTLATPATNTSANKANGVAGLLTILNG